MKGSDARGNKRDHFHEILITCKIQWLTDAGKDTPFFRKIAWLFYIYLQFFALRRMAEVRNENEEPKRLQKKKKK